jgi:hypothetical protein
MCIRVALCHWLDSAKNIKEVEWHIVGWNDEVFYLDSPSVLVLHTSSLNKPIMQMFYTIVSIGTRSYVWLIKQKVNS